MKPFPLRTSFLCTTAWGVGITSWLVILNILVLVVVVVLWLVIELVSAPIGHEDAEGFHWL